MTEFDQAIDMMAEEAARVIRSQKRVIREQESEIRELETEKRAYMILTIIFALISIAAAVTLLIG